MEARACSVFLHLIIQVVTLCARVGRIDTWTHTHTHCGPIWLLTKWIVELDTLFAPMWLDAVYEMWQDIHPVRPQRHYFSILVCVWACVCACMCGFCHSIRKWKMTLGVSVFVCLCLKQLCDEQMWVHPSAHTPLHQHMGVAGRCNCLISGASRYQSWDIKALSIPSEV